VLETIKFFLSFVVKNYLLSFSEKSYTNAWSPPKLVLRVRPLYKIPMTSYFERAMDVILRHSKDERSGLSCLLSMVQRPLPACFECLSMTAFFVIPLQILQDFISQNDKDFDKFMSGALQSL